MKTLFSTPDAALRHRIAQLTRQNNELQQELATIKANIEKVKKMEPKPEKPGESLFSRHFGQGYNACLRQVGLLLQLPDAD